MNDNEFYNFCMKELTKYEDNYDIDPFDSLKKMVDLYDLIKKTNFHDIGDRSSLSPSSLKCRSKSTKPLMV